MALNNLNTELQKGHMQNTSATLLRNAIVKDGESDFSAGAAVKLSSVEGRVELIDAVTDIIYGIVPYTPKKDTFSAKDAVRIVKENAIIVMEASAAVAIGAQVEMVVSGMKVKTATATGTPVGIALQAAAADGDLIKVELEILRPLVAVA